MNKKKKRILPQLAINGIRKNSSTYLPYIGISIFAIFTYFVFDLILHNDIIKTLPRAQYAFMLMTVGFWLLGIIIFPFLCYTNSFLIKRRKKELGLYSILGMEKKHIGMMMLMETSIIYIIVCIGAILLGLLFSKLLFLLLLNLTGLPVDVSFSFSWQAVRNAMIFYAVISIYNLIVNLVQVGKANPIELMSQSKKGEKEPKFIGIWTVLGITALGYGYYIAIKAQLNSYIFMDFFLAVFFVIVGTYFLFTSGSIFFLRRIKKNNKIYYTSSNFITVSGMLYRMKKSAASLVNICIFSTMVIITVICTVSLYLGIPGIKEFMYPFNVEVNFMENSFENREAWKEEVEKLAEEEGLEIEKYQAYSAVNIHIAKDGNHITGDVESLPFADRYRMRLMTKESFNGLEGTSYDLEQEEILVFSSGLDYGLDNMVFENQTYTVKEEIKHTNIQPKAQGNTFGEEYTVVVSDDSVLQKISAIYYVDSTEQMIYKVEMKVKGSDEQVNRFSEKVNSLSSGLSGFGGCQDYTIRSREIESMNGGLLFIGIFFGIIFFMCLLIIMYYKQISEGFEDQKNFDIMQKVGMSDEEVRSTIKKQILLVFFLPLIGAVLHTVVGMNMVIMLMGTLNFFNIFLSIASAVCICVVFTIIYIFSYNRTAKSYYKIVRKMA